MLKSDDAAEIDEMTSGRPPVEVIVKLAVALPPTNVGPTGNDVAPNDMAAMGGVIVKVSVFDVAGVV